MNIAQLRRKRYCFNLFLYLEILYMVFSNVHIVYIIVLIRLLASDAIKANLRNNVIIKY